MAKKHDGGYSLTQRKKWFKLKAEEMAQGRVVTKYPRVSINIDIISDIDKIEFVEERSIIDLVFSDANDLLTAKLLLIRNLKHVFNYHLKKDLDKPA